MTGVRDRIARIARRRPVVGVLRLHGVIGALGRIGRGGLSDAALATPIERAFAPRRLAAVALSINSPGGSPAQSAMIAARIRRLAAKREVPVIAFCEDVAASGGYWLACAADEIFADETSILGSIGVISAGFGFQEAMARLGVERRMHIVGENKSLADPFRPETERDAARIKRLQTRIHDSFAAEVRRARGDRLSGEAEIFSGEVWVGAEAVANGLIDGLGHLVPVMRDRFGEEVRFRVCEPRRGLMQRLGAPGAAELAAAVETRGLWSRYGL